MDMDMHCMQCLQLLPLNVDVQHRHPIRIGIHMSVHEDEFCQGLGILRYAEAY